MPTLIEHFRDVLDTIAAGAKEREESRTLPTAEVRLLAAAGFGRLRLPVAEGGFGASLVEVGELLIELAAADSNLVQIWRGHLAFVEDLRHARDPDYRARWAERIAGGAVVGNAWSEIGSVERGSLATTVTFQGRDARVSGTKYYTTGTIYADYADATVSDSQGRHHIAIVPLDQEGVTVRDDWDGFGQTLTGTGTLELDEAVVPAVDVFAFERKFGYQTALYQWVLLSVQAGIARAIVREVSAAVAARERTYSHGNADRVRHDPQVLQAVGQIEATAYTAEALVDKVGRALDRADRAAAAGETSGEADVTAELESAKAQVVLSRTVPEAATALFDTLGASGVRRAQALDRHWRNARTVASHNPWIFKARAVGDHAVNGTEPTFVWSIGTVRRSA